MVNKVLNGITNAIFNEFGSDYEIHTDNVKQGLKEPCFFVALLEPSQTQIIGNRYHRNYPFDIHFFPIDDQTKQSQIRNVAERLFGCLEYISFEDSMFRGSEMHYEIVDDVLHFFVGYPFTVIKEQNKLDEMETLNVNSGVANG